MNIYGVRGCIIIIIFPVNLVSIEHKIGVIKSNEAQQHFMAAANSFFNPGPRPLPLK